jgi:hypothetical protein
VAIRANDVALRYLSEKRRDPHPAGHLRNETHLIDTFAMIEFHDADRICLPATGTGKLPQPPQEVNLLAPATVPPFPAPCGLRVAGWPTWPEARRDQTV